MKTSIQNELELLRKQHDGLIRPTDVVDFARDPKTALHERFTWDDGKAATEYRLWQAREIIRVSVTFMPSIEKEYRTYVSLLDDRQREGGGYRSVVSVLKNPARRETMLSEALAELDGFRQRYAMLKELAPVFAAIDRVKTPRKAAQNRRVARRRKSLAIA